MTYEQALAVAQAGETDEDILIIDGVTRAIMVPSGQQFFGVMTDKDVERRKFRCPKVVGDNIDLSQMHLYIHYENGAGKAGAYMIRDMAVNGDYITFSWVLGENLLLYKGTVNFLLCAKKADTNGIIKNVWNTLPAEGTVSEGMEAVDVVEESRNPDVIEQMLVLLENVSDQPNIANVQVRENIKAGDKVPTLWGKVRKWFLDLGTAAFCSVVNNLAYEAENGVLDARQGKKLNEAIAKINKTLGDSDISAIGDGTVTNAISTLNSKPSTLKYITCQIRTEANEVVVLTKDAIIDGEVPTHSYYIPVIIGQSATNSYLCDVRYDNPYWVVYSSVSQNITIIFYRCIK